MNKTHYILITIAVILLILGISGFFGSTSSVVNPGTNSTNTPNTSYQGNYLEKANMIVADTPKPNQTISSPVQIAGKARGNWYFEASFPARVLDANGNQLGLIAIQAQSEWMTTEFVPFSTSLSYSMPTTRTGTIVLEKDNPSGLPENDDSLIIPVVFSEYNANAPATTSPAVTALKIFFGKSGTVAECEKVTFVTRQVLATTAVGKASIEELLKGPNPAEMGAGYITSIPAGVKLKSLDIQNGVAKADFSTELDNGVAGSCRVGAIRAQISETLKQFRTVNSVVISIDGDSTDILQP